MVSRNRCGSFAVVYAIVVGIFVHKRMALKKIIRVGKHAFSDIGMIMFIILMSGMMGYVIIIEQLPQGIAQALLSQSSEPHFVLI